MKKCEVVLRCLSWIEGEVKWRVGVIVLRYCEEERATESSCMIVTHEECMRKSNISKARHALTPSRDASSLLYDSSASISFINAACDFLACRT